MSCHGCFGSTGFQSADSPSGLLVLCMVWTQISGLPTTPAARWEHVAIWEKDETSHGLLWLHGGWDGQKSFRDSQLLKKVQLINVAKLMDHNSVSFILIHSAPDPVGKSTVKLLGNIGEAFGFARPTPVCFIR